MKALKITGIVIGIITLVVILLGLIAPKDFSMQRNIQINADSDSIFKMMSDLKKFHDWSPWSKLDPNSKVEYRGTPSTIGHEYYWKGNDKVGEGTLTITKINGTNLEYKLNFISPWESKATGNMITEKSENGAKATWIFKTHYGFIESIFMMFMDMEGMLGADFENGLKNLKKIAEKQ